MSAVRTFIDTNILIYAFTRDEPEKQKLALNLLDACLPVVSTQVIREFSNVLLKRTNLGIQAVRDTVNEIISTAETVNEDTRLILASFAIYGKYKFSFYDSLIITAAIQAKCRILLSEDMQDGQVLGGKLKIVNPFLKR